ATSCRACSTPPLRPLSRPRSGSSVAPPRVSSPGAPEVAGLPPWSSPFRTAQFVVKPAESERTVSDTSTDSAAVEVSGPAVPRSGDILTSEALAFVADLQRRFGRRRDELLARRTERRAAAARTGR